VLVLDDSKAWSPLDFGDMFMTHLGCDPRVAWVKLKIASGEDLITSELVASFDAFVLTGSRFNCRDRESLAWFEPLVSLIKAVEADDSKRLYGGCFGCQIVAHALGGKVDKNPSGRFALLAETLDFSSHREGDDCPPLNIPELPVSSSVVKVIVSHGDCVLELPPSCSRRLASSKSCNNEAYVTGRHHNILCLQSHPEFDYDYAVRDRIWPAVVDKNQRLTPDEAAASWASFEAFGGRGDGPDLLMAMVRAFLRV